MRSPSERLEKSITKDNLWIYILTLLKEGELYPYEINEKIKARFGFTPGEVTAYIVLRKLRSGGYVEVSRTEQSGGPERKYFKITKKGVAELEKITSLVQGFYKTIADMSA